MAQELDADETFIRDELRLNVTNWAKFRYTINIGVRASNLKTTSGGAVTSDVEEAYRELGKSHHEVILSLGSTKLSLNLAQTALGFLPRQLAFKKSIKDFYFHIGCLLDNLARLIYIVNDPNCTTAVHRTGQLIRHRMDWGMLRRRYQYPSYSRITRSRMLNEIINVRNALTHDWSCPVYWDRDARTPVWPVAIRKKRAFYWPFDEEDELRRKYRKWVSILTMMSEDFDFIESFQSNVFSKLSRDIVRFERNHNVEIG